MSREVKSKVKCCIKGCDRIASYKKDEVCQMHYFRKMRFGTYELTTKGKRKPRIENPAGYQKIYDKEHELSDHNGYVYEHRSVYYASRKPIDNCEICNKSINWKTLHIDHIDDNVRNNELSNLRPLCRNCNTTKNRTNKNLNQNYYKCRGLNLTLSQWERREEVKVSRTCIKSRLDKGIDIENAIFGERQTHKNCTVRTKRLKYLTEDYLN